MLVPQLAQLNAPTAFFMRDFPLTAPLTSGVLGGGGSTTGGRLSVLGPAAAEPEIELRALLKVGHPEHAEVPPVPSHLPSPGHVPARCGFAVETGCAGSLDGAPESWPCWEAFESAFIAGDLGDINGLPPEFLYAKSAIGLASGCVAGTG